MAQTLKPGTVAGEELSEAVFSDGNARQSGIIEDYTGGSLAVTSDGSSTTVSVAAGKALARGLVYENTAPVAVTLGSLGTQPTSGQERYSLVVIRVTTTADYSVEITARTGTPAAVGSASIPSAVRDASTWEVPLALVKQTGTGAVTQGAIVDRRSWTGNHQELKASDTVSGPIGSTRGRGTAFYRIGPDGEVIHDSADPTGAYVIGQSSGAGVEADSGTSGVSGNVAQLNAVVFSTNRRYEVVVTGEVRAGSLSLNSAPVGGSVIFSDSATAYPTYVEVAGTESSRNVHVRATFLYEPPAGSRTCAMRVERRTAAGRLYLSNARWYVKDIGPRS